MTIQPSVIEELRTMFKDGATPSRLIQHIVARHPNEKRNWHGLIQDYFREGFGVSIVRGLSPTETYDDIDLRYAYLNEDVLHEMVRSRAMWDQEVTKNEFLPSWLDSLVATDPVERLQELQKIAPPPDLAECWSTMSNHEKSAVLLASSGSKGRTEMVRILARLAERLQQRIIALEQDQPEPSVKTTR